MRFMETFFYEDRCDDSVQGVYTWKHRDIITAENNKCDWTDTAIPLSES